jgi:DNA repair protein RadC
MDSNNQSIKSWAAEDRPREKMMLKGKEALSNAELLAILLGSGSKNETAVQLAQRILSSATNLNALGKKEIKYFTQFKGIGEAKAITIGAALELGRRRQSEPAEKRTPVTSSHDAYQVIGPRLQDIPHEEFWILCLNRRNEIINTEKISSGGVTATVADPKIIFKHALSHLATSIILVHNHPSGSVDPSQEDLKITEKLSQGGKVLDIKVLDHLIIGNGRYYSFMDQGLI